MPPAETAPRSRRLRQEALWFALGLEIGVMTTWLDGPTLTEWILASVGVAGVVYAVCGVGRLTWWAARRVLWRDPQSS